MDHIDLKKAHAQFSDYLRFTCMLSPSTVRNHVKVFDLLIKRFPHLTPDMIDPDLLTDFFKWLWTRDRIVGRGTRITGIKRSTVATYWRKLSRFFAWLRVKGILAVNPLKTEGMQCPQVYYADKKFLDRSDIEKIMAAISFKIRWPNDFLRTRNLALISVAANCGLRRGELLALRLKDIDLMRNEITVRAATSKSHSDRTVPLNSRARRDLDSYLDQRKARGFTTEYVWVSDRCDRPITIDGLRNMLKMVVVGSKVKFHLHQLRHTFAVNFLHNSGQNSFKLQRLLGHRSIVSTAIYTRCLPIQAIRADVERLSDLENTL